MQHRRPAPNVGVLQEDGPTKASRNVPSMADYGPDLQVLAVQLDGLQSRPCGKRVRATM